MKYKKQFVVMGLVATSLGFSLTSCSGSKTDAGSGSQENSKAAPGLPSPNAKDGSVRSKPNPGELTVAILKSSKDDDIKDLLFRGADKNEKIEAKTQHGEWITPLIAAVITKNHTIARVLVNQGANKEVLFKGYTPSDLAHELNDAEMESILE